MQWSTRSRPAAIAKDAEDRRSIEVLTGKWDTRLRERAKLTPDEITAEFGCHRDVVVSRIRMLAGAFPVIRKTSGKRRPR